MIISIIYQRERERGKRKELGGGREGREEGGRWKERTERREGWREVTHVYSKQTVAT